MYPVMAIKYRENYDKSLDLGGFPRHVRVPKSQIRHFRMADSQVLHDHPSLPNDGLDVIVNEHVTPVQKYPHGKVYLPWILCDGPWDEGCHLGWQRRPWKKVSTLLFLKRGALAWQVLGVPVIFTWIDESRGVAPFSQLGRFFTTAISRTASWHHGCAGQGAWRFGNRGSGCQLELF